MLLLSALTILTLVFRIVTTGNYLQRSAIVTVLLLASTSFKMMYQFSSRYIVAVAPFLILAVVLEAEPFGKRHYVLWSCGAAIGLIALLGKYFIPEAPSFM
jgi:hypothetical protein